MDVVSCIVAGIKSGDSKFITSDFFAEVLQTLTIKEGIDAEDITVSVIGNVYKVMLTTRTAINCWVKKNYTDGPFDYLVDGEEVVRCDFFQTVASVERRYGISHIQAYGICKDIFETFSKTKLTTEKQDEIQKWCANNYVTSKTGSTFVNVDTGEKVYDISKASTVCAMRMKFELSLSEANSNFDCVWSLSE